MGPRNSQHNQRRPAGAPDGFPQMTDAFPLKWPQSKPRTHPDKRRYPVFRSARNGQGLRPVTVAVAIERLERELDLLKARYPVVSTNLERRLNGLPWSGQPDPRDPGVAVYFELAGKPHCLPCDTYQTVAANIAAIAAHIEAARSIERYGVASISEMFAGFLSLPSPDMMDWRRVLQLHREGAINSAKVEEAYRRLARERHPDHGGSDAMMAELNEARSAARRELGNAA